MIRRSFIVLAVAGAVLSGQEINTGPAVGQPVPTFSLIEQGERTRTYPLLSDPDSKIIRAFGILNETVKPGSFAYGIPNPGIYVVDTRGKVISKYFEDDFKERISTADILAGSLGAPADKARESAKTKHLEITTAASNGLARPGLRIRLSVEIVLKPGMHVYAPGVKGYIPIDRPARFRRTCGEAPQLQLPWFRDVVPCRNQRNRPGLSESGPN